MFLRPLSQYIFAVTTVIVKKKKKLKRNTTSIGEYHSTN